MNMSSRRTGPFAADCTDSRTSKAIGGRVHHPTRKPCDGMSGASRSPGRGRLETTTRDGRQEHSGTSAWDVPGEAESCLNTLPICVICSSWVFSICAGFWKGRPWGPPRRGGFQTSGRPCSAAKIFDTAVRVSCGSVFLFEPILDLSPGLVLISGRVPKLNGQRDPAVVEVAVRVESQSNIVILVDQNPVICLRP